MPFNKGRVTPLESCLGGFVYRKPNYIFPHLADIECPKTEIDQNIIVAGAYTQVIQIRVSVVP